MLKDLTRMIHVKTKLLYAMKNCSHNVIYFVQVFIFITLITFINTNISFSYDPPIGIPDPGNWGSVHPIDSSAPSQPGGWPSSEVTNYYYIDNTDGNATDIENTYGYPDKPRMTIPKIIYPEGAYIEVHGGPYTVSNLQLKFNGTSSNPVWFRGTPTSFPLFTGRISISDSTHLIMEYLHFNGGNGGCIIINGADEYVCIRNSIFENRIYVSNDAGIGIQPDLGDTIHDIVFYNNNLNTLGDYQTLDDQDFHGINPNTWGRDNTTEEYNIWILENTFYHCSGDGVQVTGGNWDGSHDALHHVYIGNNTSYENRQSGFYCKQASDVIISENVVYGMRQHGPQEGNGIGILYSPDNLWIIYNKIYNCNNGIRQGDCTVYSGGGCSAIDHNLYIVGNVIYDIKRHNGTDNGFNYLGCGIKLYYGSMNRYVVNNTLYDVRYGLQAIQAGPLIIEQNIIAEIDSAYDPTFGHMYIHNNVTADTEIGKNLLFDPDDGTRIYWGGTIYTSLSSFQTAISECNDCITDSPNFTDEVNNNFNIESDSAAKDNGKTHPIYTDFYNRYAIDIFVGKNSIKRPQGSAIDIGAYELEQPPLPPGNLRIVP